MCIRLNTVGLLQRNGETDGNANKIALYVSACLHAIRSIGLTAIPSACKDIVWYGILGFNVPLDTV